MIKKSNITDELSSASFSITDSGYGITAEIDRCQDCGFMQCSKTTDVLGYYRELEDVDYVETSAVRALQHRQLLKRVSLYKSSGRLLDIGAGSGILVSEAIKMGFDAVGVEPSQWLQGQAKKEKLPVFLGTFPNPNIAGNFDIITVIDVLEHVSDPVELLRGVAGALAPKGVGVIVTPNVTSLAARIMRWKWWHYRIAHIGFFNRRTLALALERAGLTVRDVRRPGWYFNVEYLAERLGRYVPIIKAGILPKRIRQTVIPVNLGDSLLVVCEKARHEAS